MHAFAARLAPASLAGLRFEVASDEIEAGRRHAVHTIPNGGHVVEEFGAQPRRYSVTAYCGGVSAAARAQALLDLDRRVGPHLLVLPTASAMVVVDRATRSFDKARLGYVAVNLTLVDAGVVSAPGFGASLLSGASLAALDNRVFVAAAAALALVGPFVAASVRSLPAAGVGFEGPATSGGIAAAARVETVRGLVAGGGGTVRPSEAAARVVEIGERIEALAVAAVDLVASPEAWGSLAAEIMGDLAAVADPSTWMARAAGLATVSDPLPPPAVATAATAAASSAAEIGARALAVASLVTFAEAAVMRTYADRAAAVAVRARLAELFAAEIEDLAGLAPPPLDLIRALIEVRDRTVVALRARATTLAPVVTVSASTTRPALVWAWDLYRDPSRAGEIAARNRIDHPGFVPPTFEALAR